MSRLPLSFACWDYDRVKALQDGTVRAEGIDLNFLPLRVEETFYRALHNREFDVCELSLSSYLLTLESESPPFVAIPVFPSRFFRHQSIYVNTDTIHSPSDLIGKKVGSPEYQMTACVWQRGILADHYDVPVDGVQYFTGALSDTRRRQEKVPLHLPDNISVTPIAEGKNLSEMLAAGEIDAIYTAPAPHTFGKAPNVGQLFPDFRQVEEQYFKDTRIFPIMHVIAIKRDTYLGNPWIARSLMKAFNESLEYGYRSLHERSALKYMLPWLQEHVSDTLDALGQGYWNYGLASNDHVLRTFAEYSYGQGLTKKLWSPGDMFVAGADDGFQI